MMYKFDQEKANKKWMSIIDMLPFENDNHNDKMCKFAELFSLNEYTPYSTLSGVGIGECMPPSMIGINGEPMKKEEEWESLLPLNLKVLSKVTNLDKIIIMDGPQGNFDWKGVSKTIQVKSLSIDVTLHRDDMFIDPQIQYEHTIIYEVAKVINDKIDEGYTIFVYMPIQSIKLIAEKTMAPKLYIISRITFLKD